MLHIRRSLFAVALLVSATLAAPAGAQTVTPAVVPERAFPFIGRTCVGMMTGNHYEFTWHRWNGTSIEGTVVINNWRNMSQPVAATFNQGRLTGAETSSKWPRRFSFQITQAGMTGEVWGAAHGTQPWRLHGTLTCS